MTAHGPLSVPTPPAMPLARTVEMPTHIGYPSGALSLRFTEVTVEPTREPDAVAVSDGDRTVLGLPPLLVRARYAIDATPDRVATVDGGGDLSLLSESATAPRSGDETETHPEWLDNARDQRMRLAQTENGASLLNLYDQHTDVFAELFDPNLGTFTKDIWTKGDTSTMAADTHDAVKNDTGLVNDPDKTYSLPSGTPANYNLNAFVRQVGASTYIHYLDPDYDPTDPTKQTLQPKYQEAVDAVGKFAETVKGTGNDKGNTTAMTSEQIYQTVNTHSGEPAELPSEQLAAMRNPFADDVWEGRDDDERDLIRQFHRQARAGREELRAAAVPTSLFEGSGTGRITGAAVVTDAAGAVRVEFPDFDLALDDSAWTGAAADIARDRLNAAGFLAGLVRDAVAERLRVAVLAGEPSLLTDPPQ
ncbi:hypothetical protein K7711_18875 [Nocardia sp. CA2R105]|uniref:hypothetical protein n=1 Tax=Nocardia coffeae TaxID=2873381 RepID=UPI001CA63935|nr:hypothetical protein [Nocardia coffeae]MBY8858550.1 hypothetical protein [Nocardia coffeae]